MKEKILFINLSGSQFLGEKTVVGLKEKYRVPLAAVISSDEEQIETLGATPVSERVMSIELSELFMRKQARKQSVKVREVGSRDESLMEENYTASALCQPGTLMLPSPDETQQLLDDLELERMKVQIRQFLPDKIILAVHGSLQDSNRCYYEIFGEPSAAVLGSAADLATFTRDLTSTMTSQGKDNLTLLMCYGARLALFDLDHSLVACDDFQSSFAYQFIHAYGCDPSAEFYQREALHERQIHMEAFLGSVGVDATTGEFQVDSESKIYFDRMIVRLLVPINMNRLRIQDLSEKELKTFPQNELKGYTREYDRDAPCELSRRMQLANDYMDFIGNNELFQSLYRDDGKDNHVNGVIDFTFNHQEVVCKRRNKDAPYDPSRFAKLESQIRDTLLSPYYQCPKPPTQKDKTIQRLLSTLQYLLADIKDLDVLNSSIESFQKTKEYHVCLEEGSNTYGSFFSSPSKSAGLLAFETLCSDARALCNDAIIDKPIQTVSPSP